MSHKVKVVCGSREIRNLLVEQLSKSQPDAKLETSEEGGKYLLIYLQDHKPDLDRNGMAKGASFKERMAMKTLETMGLVKFEYLGEVEDVV